MKNKYKRCRDHSKPDQPIYTDTSSKDTCSKDTSSKDTSSKDTSSKDTSGKDTSSKDTSSKDTSSKDKLDLPIYTCIHLHIRVCTYADTDLMTTE